MPSPSPPHVVRLKRKHIYTSFVSWVGADHSFESVNPLYYVTFTTATLCASFILFGGFNTTDTVNTLSLLCGFLVTFTGVYLLNLSRADPNGLKMLTGQVDPDATGTDIISSIQTRLSMQSRRSIDPVRRSTGTRSDQGDRTGLMRAYDEEAQLGPAEESDEEASLYVNVPDRSITRVGALNGTSKTSSTTAESIEMQPRKSYDR